MQHFPCLAHLEGIKGLAHINFSDKVKHSETLAFNIRGKKKKGDQQFFYIFIFSD